MNVVYVKSKSETDLGSMILDYIYVGPLTDETGSTGQNHETEGDALFFDFSNDTASQLRYQGSQYKLFVISYGSSILESLSSHVSPLSPCTAIVSAERILDKTSMCAFINSFK